MSYHVMQTAFEELPKRIIVREDGYMDAYKQEGIPITDYVYVLQPAMNTGMLSNPADELRTLADELHSVRFDDKVNYIKNVETLYLSMLAMREAADIIERLTAECDSLADRLLSATREREQFRMMCGEIWPTVRMDGAFNNLAKAPEIGVMEGGLLMTDNRTPVKNSPAKAKGDCTICNGWVDDGRGGTCVFTDDFWTPRCPYDKAVKR